jgi:sterol desaturase/sphingolipid hydroxylase (fatty acid hydroxylase superfamily)
MENDAQLTEAAVRLSLFVVLFLVIALAEAARPMRERRIPRRRRWSGNLGLSVLNQLLIRVLMPTTAILLAVAVEQRQGGLLGWVSLPAWIEIGAALLVLDLAIYLQHRIYHAIPVLWRFHRMHHADVEFDVSTGIRFHPLPTLLSAAIKLGVVWVLGPAPVAVLIFEVLLNATSMFNHSNLRLPPVLDRVLRFVVVTPDMHRVHHSTDPDETNRNFGFNFPWWDRLFGSYRAQPALGHQAMRIGLEQFRDPAELRMDRLLTQPFRGGP